MKRKEKLKTIDLNLDSSSPPKNIPIDLQKLGIANNNGDGLGNLGTAVLKCEPMDGWIDAGKGCWKTLIICNNGKNFSLKICGNRHWVEPL